MTARKARPAAPARPVSIIDALASPALFAKMFDAPSWRPWRVFLKALFALPLDDAELALYRKHTGRTEPPATPFREAALVCGRRGGKSRILALLGVYLAAVPDYTQFIAPGETPVVAVIAADRKQARVILAYVVGLLHAVPALDAMVEDELAESVRLSNGVAIEIHTASIGAPRGRTFVAILADEIGFWSSDGGANPDRDVIAAVRPGLATLPNSLLLMASSPYARRGVLFDTFSRHFGKDAAPVLVWRGTTLEMNSALDPRIVEDAYEADPENASAEYGAEFRSDIAPFIDRAAVEAVVAGGILELPPAAGISYLAYTDPSGGSADPMTLAIAHMGADGIAVLDAVRERKPPFSPDDVTEEFAALLHSYGITRVCGDAYAGEWPRARFASHGIAYDVSTRNKSAIYTDFLPALNGQRIRLLDLPRLVAQLCTLERRTSRAGKDTIDHGPGQHDDVANAVAGALCLAITDDAPAIIRSRDLAPDGPVEPVAVHTMLGTLYIAPSGRAAWCALAHADLAVPPLVLCDFDVCGFTPSLIEHLVRRLDEIAAPIRARRRNPMPHIFYLAVPRAYHRAALAALSTVLGNANYVSLAAAEVRDEKLLADPARLLQAVAAHVGAGKVRLSPHAASRAGELPLFAALAVRANEALGDDPLRAAALLGIGLGLGLDF